MAHPVKSQLTVDVAASAQKTWDLIADFGTIKDWWPDPSLEKVTCDGDGVGMTRYLHITGGIVINEKLTSLDPAGKVLTLTIDGDMPAGIENYRATGKVVETGPNSCQLVWAGEYDVPSADGEADARGFIEGAYGAQAQGIKSAVEG